MSVCVIAYAGVKLIILITGRGPNINTNLLENDYDKNFGIDLNEVGFQIAFEVRDADNKYEHKD